MSKIEQYLSTQKKSSPKKVKTVKEFLEEDWIDYIKKNPFDASYDIPDQMLTPEIVFRVFNNTQVSLVRDKDLSKEDVMKYARLRASGLRSGLSLLSKEERTEEVLLAALESGDDFRRLDFFSMHIDDPKIQRSDYFYRKILAISDAYLVFVPEKFQTKERLLNLFKDHPSYLLCHKGVFRTPEFLNELLNYRKDLFKFIAFKEITPAMISHADKRDLILNLSSIPCDLVSDELLLEFITHRGFIDARFSNRLTPEFSLEMIKADIDMFHLIPEEVLFVRGGKEIRDYLNEKWESLVSGYRGSKKSLNEFARKIIAAVNEYDSPENMSRERG